VGGNTGLFALRAKSGTKQGRLFYFFALERKIIFVHSLETKKTRRFQQHDLDLALRRKREVETAEDMNRVIKAFTVLGEGNDYQTH
jgi:phage-related protein